ncbi:MAG: PAS domain-containing protein [Nitrospira sp.]|nr:PAS domain-containing protein [Nitrospira sp.]
MMNTLNNLRTRAKLLLISGLIGVALLLVGGMSIAGLMDLSGRIEAIFKINVLPLKQLGELQGDSQRMSALVAGHILGRDSATMKRRKQEIAQLDEKIKKFQADYAPIIVTESEQKIFDRFKSEWTSYQEIRGKVLTLSDNFSKDAAAELQDSQLAEKLTALLDCVNGLVKENEAQAQDSHESSRSASMTLIMLMIALIGGSLVLSLFANWAISKFLVSGLDNVLQAARQLQSGNASFRSTVTTKEEIGQLAEAFNHMASSLEAASAKQQAAIEEMNACIDIMNTTSIVSKSNPKGDIITVNDKFLDISKYSREELIGKPHSIVRHPDMPKEVFKQMWATIGRGQIFRGIVKNRAKDGTPYYVDAVIKPLMGPNGKPREYLGVRYDITQYEIARHNMEGMVDAINTSYATVECDLHGQIQTANGIFLQLTGYSLEEIKGKSHSMFVDPSDNGTLRYRALWDKCVRGEPDVGQYKYLGKGGRVVWLQASYNPVKDDVGRPFKVLLLGIDMTEQKQALVEVEKLIKAAAVGQLSERIKTDIFSGDLRDLTDSVNRLLDSVTQPLHEAQGVLSALAANDLSRGMTGAYHGEFEEMKCALNSALTNLTSTITTVRQTVGGVTTGAGKITTANRDLSERTSQQAAALEETSASMEEMTATVKQNADNAKQADQLAITARETADKGRVVTQHAVEAMDEINKSSRKIADIITVIDEIAFQTNLLALNAAVEAARAGEHGRGFAVVAAEVRNLAQRSATAAKEIKGLIKESIQRVNDGSDLVNQSGQTLEEIVHSVKRVTDIIAEISAASQEQAVGIDQVNRAISAMDQATQRNVGVVEETANAAQSMHEQAGALQQQVQVFKVAKGHYAEPMLMRHPCMPLTGAPTIKPVTREVGHAVMSRKQVVAPPSVQKEPVGAAVRNDKAHHAVEETFEEF